MKSLAFVPAVLFAGLSACTGANGADGSSCTVTDNADGSATITCDDGSSVTVTNGADGSDAPHSLIATTPEAPGNNCSTGGQRIDHGVDDDGDGVLDADEIDGTVYACNGSDGSDGSDGSASLIHLTPEPVGGTCQAGGQRVDYGIDDDGNGTLDPAEIDGTQYVCNGPVGNRCVIDFAAGWAATGEGSDPTAFYSAWGATFVGKYGLVGGDLRGDQGNWNNVNEAWGIWAPGFASATETPTIHFSAPAVEVSVELQRAFDDFTANVVGYVNGVAVETVTLSPAGPYNVQTATFTKIVDELRIEGVTGTAFVVDNLKYKGDFGCPQP